jgi:hypothetical protein
LSRLPRVAGARLVTLREDPGGARVTYAIALDRRP